MNNELKDLLEIKERLVKIEVLLSEKINNLENRIYSLESNQRWATKIIIASIIISLLSLLSLKY